MKEPLYASNCNTCIVSHHKEDGQKQISEVEFVLTAT
jgi:hypothetical protein